MACYLIHFDKPYKHARHYCGHTDDLEARLLRHASGNGARLMEVVNEAGIGWTLARVWESGDKDFERWLKRQKNNPRFCPICRAQ